MNAEFILAAFAVAVEKESAVFADVANDGACGMIAAPRKRINQQLIGGVPRAAEVDGFQVLIRKAHLEKIAAGTFARQLKSRDVTKSR